MNGILNKDAKSWWHLAGYSVPSSLLLWLRCQTVLSRCCTKECHKDERSSCLFFKKPLYFNLKVRYIDRRGEREEDHPTIELLTHVTNIDRTIGLPIKNSMWTLHINLLKLIGMFHSQNTLSSISNAIWNIKNDSMNPNKILNIKRANENPGE